MGSLRGRRVWVHAGERHTGGGLVGSAVLLMGKTIEQAAGHPRMPTTGAAAGATPAIRGQVPSSWWRADMVGCSTAF
jgi:hypothetical protein